MSGPDATTRRRPAVARLETFTALGVVAVLALLLAAAAWTRPTRTTEDRSVAYVQSAEVRYTADTAPDSTYGVSGMQPGETVILDEVEELRVRVTYSLETPGSSDLRGTADLDAVVAVAGGLRRTFPVAETSVDGPQAVLKGVLPLEAIRDYLLNSRSLLGDAGAAATATVTLNPVFTVGGTLDGRPLRTTFEPTVELLLTEDTLAVVTDDGEPVLADSSLLNPSETGELTYTADVPATLPLLLASPPVTLVRWGTLLVLLGCLLPMAMLGRRLFGQPDDSDEAERLLGLHGSRIVSVTELSLRDGPVADVATFDDLLDLARRYNSLVMHVSDDRGDTFSLWDTGLTYRYRIGATGDGPRPAAQAPGEAVVGTTHDPEEAGRGTDSHSGDHPGGRDLRVVGDRGGRGPRPSSAQ